MDELNKILNKAINNGCSDVHLKVGNKPLFRKNGILIVSGENVITKNLMNNFIGILSNIDKEILEEVGEVDFSYTASEARFRGNAFVERGNYSFSFRTIPKYVPTIEELSLPPIMKRLCDLDRGLVLVTGPTGSGKSTTLASMINYINKTKKKRIITLEDPIEYYHADINSNIVQREVGKSKDTKSFSNGLRASLRQDPDVILVGEMRDLETISTAISASETGHLVFSTLHSIDTASTIERIIDVFPSEQQNTVKIQLANVLAGVISQRLLLKADQSGRVASFEILLNNNATANLIRTNKLSQIQSVIESNRGIGMRTMKDSFDELVEKGIVEESEIERYKNNF